MPTWQSAFDAVYLPGDQGYWRADFVNARTDQALALHVKNAAELPTWKCNMHLYLIDGAASDVSNDATPGHTVTRSGHGSALASTPIHEIVTCSHAGQKIVDRAVGILPPVART